MVLTLTHAVHYNTLHLNDYACYHAKVIECIQSLAKHSCLYSSDETLYMYNLL